MDSILGIFGSLTVIVLVIIAFSASIFVHELGHYLAARWRGLKVERFSIGFGPRVFGWRRKGIDYRVSLLPLGGYVALPQLADLRGIEGAPEDDTERLPPISYTDKMIVSVAGAVFNVLFALAVGTVLWVIGTQTTAVQQTNEIGHVFPTVTTAEQQEVTSPASLAGLQAGDRILAVDGTRVADWRRLQYLLITSKGREDDGRPRTVLTIERDGEELKVPVNPVLAGEEGLRLVGITAGERVVLGEIFPDSPAEVAGLQPGDEIIALNGQTLFSPVPLGLHLQEHPDEPALLTVRRTTEGGDERLLEVPLMPEEVTVNTLGDTAPHFGFRLDRPVWLEHVDPVSRLVNDVHLTWRVLSALVSRDSNVGVDDLSGPPGILYALYETGRSGIRYLLSLVVLININLAILNLLPIPVLDGGHMAFATVQKLTGRPLPAAWLAGVQTAFMLILFSFMIYVSVFDVKRIGRNETAKSEIRQEQAQAVPLEFTGQPQRELDQSTLQPVPIN